MFRKFTDNVFQPNTSHALLSMRDLVLLVWRNDRKKNAEIEELKRENCELRDKVEEQSKSLSRWDFEENKHCKTVCSFKNLCLNLFFSSVKYINDNNYQIRRRVQGVQSCFNAGSRLLLLSPARSLPLETNAQYYYLQHHWRKVREPPDPSVNPVSWSRDHYHVRSQRKPFDVIKTSFSDQTRERTNNARSFVSEII